MIHSQNYSQNQLKRQGFPIFLYIKSRGLKINYILAHDKSSLAALISVCWHLSNHPWCPGWLGVRSEEPLLHTIMGIWYVVVVYATCPSRLQQKMSGCCDAVAYLVWSHTLCSQHDDNSNTSSDQPSERLLTVYACVI